VTNLLLHAQRKTRRNLQLISMHVFPTAPSPTITHFIDCITVLVFQISKYNRCREHSPRQTTAGKQTQHCELIDQVRPAITCPRSRKGEKRPFQKSQLQLMQPSIPDQNGSARGVAEQPGGCNGPSLGSSSSSAVSESHSPGAGPSAA
jgi:hypothetical protein